MTVEQIIQPILILFLCVTNIYTLTLLRRLIKSQPARPDEKEHQ